MTLLTSIIGGGSSSGGSPTLVGEYKAILTGNTRQLGIANTANSNTIIESGGGIWVRAGQVYPQTSYPELFARLGLVNTSIGLTRTIGNHPLGATFTGSLSGGMAYSPDDDLYVFPMVSNGGNVVVANSSMQQFTYRQVGGSNTAYYYQAAYGGAPGTRRFIITSNVGAYILYGANSTVTGPYSITAGMQNVVFGAANTVSNTVVIVYGGTGTYGNITLSTDSGVTWSNVNTNAYYVSQVTYGNGIYLTQPFPGWVETSTNATRWTGLQKSVPAPYAHLIAGYAFHQHYVAGPATDPMVMMPRQKVAQFKGTSNNAFILSTIDPGYGQTHHYLYGATSGFSVHNHTYDNGNAYSSKIYTSTDSRVWDYRGTASLSDPYSPGHGAPRVLAIGTNPSLNSNTLFSNKLWYNYYTASGSHFYNFWSHDGHHNTHEITHVNSTNTAYNKIYQVSPANVAVVANNIFAVSANAVSADDPNWIRTIAIGVAQNGANQIVYTTDTGNIATSTDGFTWTQRATGYSNLNSSVYGKANGTNTYMLVGPSGQIVTSNNAVNWTTRTTAYSLDANGWVEVAYGNNIFVLAGNTGNLTISNDGVNFSGTNSLASVIGATYGNNNFVISMASGVIKYSIDGVFWKNTGSTGRSTDIQSVATDDTKFVYAGLGGVTGYTTNLANAWTNGTITSGSNNFFSVYYGNNTWVMGGANGSIFTSTDGITWTYRTSGTSNTILAVYYANNTYLYGGDNVLATSTDAVTWTVRNANASGALRVSALAYGNGVFVYGSQGFYGTSTDGVTWISAAAGSRDPANANVANTVYTGQINDIMYSNSNSVFVAVGAGGYIATSPNGTSWNVQNSRTGESLTSVTFGNSRFLTVGTTGTTKISPNGVLWSGHASNGNIYGIAFYSNSNVNSFVMVGSTSSVLPGANSFQPTTTYTLETSTDGVYWFTKEMKTTIPAQKVAASNAAAAIMEFGNDSQFQTQPISGYAQANGQRISISFDANTWSGLGLPANAYNYITFANNQFIATGVYGIIANSPDGLFWRTTNVGAQFSTTSSNTSANVPPAYNSGIALNWTNGFGALKYHLATSTYILPFGQGGIHFTSKDLITWTPRYTMLFSNYNNYLTEGPLVITNLSGKNITYTLNANNYVSAAYNVASEFYVPQITETYYPKPQGQTYEPADAVWYVKAKT